MSHRDPAERGKELLPLTQKLGIELKASCSLPDCRRSEEIVFLNSGVLSRERTRNTQVLLGLY